MAVVDDAHPVSQDIRLFEVLRRQEDRDAVLVGEATDLLPKRGPALGIEPGRRLVEEEQARVVDEREREIETPLHAARVRPHLPVGRFGEADAVEQLLTSLLSLPARERVQGRLQPQMLAAREQRVEGRLLQRRADRFPHARALRDDVEARDARAAGGGREKRRQDVDGR